MSDLYVHLSPLEGGWDHRQENLVTLGQYLVEHAEAIEAGGGLGFGEDMSGLPPPPFAGVRPPLAFGPDAGLGVEVGEDWPGYCRRVFGVYDHRPFMVWLQSPMWRKTDPSPVGAALRIAYVLDYGVPHDHVEIAMGQAYSDYDSNGFVWEKLDMLPPDGWRRQRKQPEWVGAVELERRRAAVTADFLVPPGEVPFSAGCSPDRINALAERFGAALPGSFNDFLMFAGRRVGGGGAYVDGLEAIDRQARTRIFAGEREGDDPVPLDAIFIGMEAGQHPEFILAGPRQDSTVFRFDGDSGRVTQVAFSVFGWAEGFMKTNPPVAPDPPAVVLTKPSWLSSIRRLFGFEPR